MPDLNPYAKYLDSRSIPEILAATPATLHFLAESIGPARLAVSPAPGKWSPAEILCHLADCELAFAYRLRQTLAHQSTPAQPHHVLQPFDQDRWAATYPGVTAHQALAAFAAAREWNLILVRNAPPNAAAIPVTHPERGVMTFATLLETMAGHDLNHILQLQRLL